MAGDEVYNRIAMLRAERGVSRRQLADALGVHYQTVGYLERGEYSPSLYLALKLAEYFEVSVEVVFSTDPAPWRGTRVQPRLALTQNLIPATRPRSGNTTASGRPERGAFLVDRIRSW